MKSKHNSLISQTDLDIARRYFLRDCGYGLGKMALASLLTSGASRIASGASSAAPLAVRQPHFEPSAKRVIQLFMAGARRQPAAAIGNR
jgi:hypothetical protein